MRLDTKSYAHARVDRALKEIERAQESLRKASELLSPIVGFAEEWEETGKLHYRIKQHWHKVHALSGGDYDIDEDHRVAMFGKEG